MGKTFYSDTGRPCRLNTTARHNQYALARPDRYWADRARHGMGWRVANGEWPHTHGRGACLYMVSTATRHQPNHTTDQRSPWQSLPARGWSSVRRLCLSTATDAATPASPAFLFQGSQKQKVKFQDNFTTFLSVSRGSRHKKCTFFCPHKCYSLKQIITAVLKMLLINQ